MEDLLSWKAIETVLECMTVLKEIQPATGISFARRKLLVQPHCLANGFRCTAHDTRRILGMQMVEALGIKTQLMEQFFFFS